MCLAVRLRCLSVLEARREVERKRLSGRGDTLCTSNVQVRDDVTGEAERVFSVRLAEVSKDYKKTKTLS